MGDLVLKEKNDLLENVNKNLVVVERALKAVGGDRKDTQFIAKAINSFMLGRTPFSIIRQALAKIRKSRDALMDAKFKYERNILLIEKYKQKAEEEEDLVNKKLYSLKVEKLRYELERSEFYIKGALKNIANYYEIYNQVRLHNNIPEDWDELDFEKAEANHHIQQAFLQAFRDVFTTGRIGTANANYLEYCGIGPFVGQMEINKFLNKCKEVIQTGTHPLMSDIDLWLIEMAEKYKDLPSEQLKFHGINAIDDWYIFKDRNLIETEEA